MRRDASPAANGFDHSSELKLIGIAHRVMAGLDPRLSKRRRLLQRPPQEGDHQFSDDTAWMAGSSSAMTAIRKNTCLKCVYHLPDARGGGRRGARFWAPNALISLPRSTERSPRPRAAA
jgi:hypothetical protein